MFPESYMQLTRRTDMTNGEEILYLFKKFFPSFNHSRDDSLLEGQKGNLVSQLSFSHKFTSISRILILLSQDSNEHQDQKGIFLWVRSGNHRLSSVYYCIKSSLLLESIICLGFTHSSLLHVYREATLTQFDGFSFRWMYLSLCTWHLQIWNFVHISWGK